MKRILVDTNILLDVLLERHPFCRPAQILWSLAERRKIKATVSTVSINDIFFILRKLSGADKAYEGLKAIVECFRLSDVTSSIISRAVAARFPDFEDAVQYFCALKFGARTILSRDPSGFAGSRIPVMDCNEYLSLIGLDDLL